MQRIQFLWRVFPYHSAQQYIDVLIEQGYKGRDCRTNGRPLKKPRGVVKREVVQVITRVQWLIRLGPIVRITSWLLWIDQEMIMVQPIWIR